MAKSATNVKRTNDSTASRGGMRVRKVIRALEQRVEGDLSHQAAIALIDGEGKLMETAKKNAEHNGKEFPVTKEAEAHWRNHYLKQFYFAIECKRLPVTKEVLTDLLEKAEQLGKEAAKLADDRKAGKIERPDANGAQLIVDCVPKKTGARDLLLDFCN